MRELFIAFINLLFGAYYLLVLIRAFLPWVPGVMYHPLFVPVKMLTDPVLNIIKKGLPPSQFGIDASPFIVIILLWLLQRIILMLIG